MSDHLDFELVPEMLSAYLDGELSAPERAAVDARLAESAEWRAELDDVRAARDAVRRLPAREAAEGFWDSLLATVGADDDAAHDDAAHDAVLPAVSIESRRPRRRVTWIAAAAALVIGLVAVIAVPRRSDVAPNVTAVVAQHGAQGSDSGDPVSMLAPVGPSGRVPTMSLTRRPAFLAVCALAAVAMAWPIGAWGASSNDSADAREAAWLVARTATRVAVRLLRHRRGQVDCRRRHAPVAGRGPRRRRRDRDRGRRRRHRDRRRSPHLSARPARMDRRAGRAGRRRACPVPGTAGS